MNELVSVIIPTFNRETTILQALESVLKQTYEPIEIIIVDDGSTDNTKDFLDKYQVNYIYQENQGVSSARNTGAKNANGMWLAFLDSDDIWFEDKIAKQIKYSLDNPKYDFIHCNERWIRSGVRVNAHNKHKKGGGDQFIASLKHCVISPSAVMMKKELFITHGGFLESYPVCEDYDLWLKIISLSEIGFIEEYLLDKNGGHIDQLSTKFFAMDYYRIKSLFWILNNRELSDCKKEALLSVLRKKCSVLIKGYIKHENLKDLPEIESIARELGDVLQA